MTLPKPGEFIRSRRQVLIDRGHAGRLPAERLGVDAPKAWSDPRALGLDQHKSEDAPLDGGPWKRDILRRLAGKLSRKRGDGEVLGPFVFCTLRRQPYITQD